MENKDSFVFYRSFWEVIKTLSSKQQLELYTAICEYALNGKTSEVSDRVVRSMFVLLKFNIDTDCGTKNHDK